MIRVVTGHICSGKTTFVRQHAAAADIVIDCDRIAVAVAREGTPDYGFAAHHREVAARVRWHAIDEAVRLHRRPGGFDVWIVHAYPTADDVAKYRRLGAAIREVTAARETLVARAAAARPPEWLASLVAELDRGDTEADLCRAASPR